MSTQCLYGILIYVAVAYVKYDKASSAAVAIEELNGSNLSQGKGPTLKVLLAES